MKNFYPPSSRILLTLVIVLCSHLVPKAQVLSVGDIAFTGYTSGGAVDSFSFVLLTNIPSGTSINFTDDAWLGAAFSGGEETVTWTSGAAMTAGREITIFGLTAIVAGAPISPGTVTGTPINLTTSGDQVLAYQGSAASPSFISGIHMNVYSTTVLDCDNTTAAAWDPLCIGSGGSFCSKPGILTTGVNALWIGVEGDATSERDNGRFNCTGPLTTAAQIRAAVNNPANWVTDQLTPNESYNPAGCTFFGPPLPLGLLSFTGTSNPDLSVTLQWKMADQQLIQGFIVEKSLDALVYQPLGSFIPASGHGLIYAFTDAQMTPGNNYYRLKIQQQSGVIAYSEILVLKNTATELIRFYPNPVTDRLTIQQSGPKPIASAVLLDGQGRTLQKVRLAGLKQVVEMGDYPKGIYILKLEDGKVIKIMKN